MCIVRYRSMDDWLDQVRPTNRITKVDRQVRRVSSHGYDGFVPGAKTRMIVRHVQYILTLDSDVCLHDERPKRGYVPSLVVSGILWSDMP